MSSKSKLIGMYIYASMVFLLSTFGLVETFFGTSGGSKSVKLFIVVSGYVMCALLIVLIIDARKSNMTSEPAQTNPANERNHE